MHSVLHTQDATHAPGWRELHRRGCRGNLQQLKTICLQVLPLARCQLPNQLPLEQRCCVGVQHGQQLLLQLLMCTCRASWLTLAGIKQAAVAVGDLMI